MPYYRVYHIGRTAQFSWVDDAECQDDREALDFARANLKGLPVELWNLARRVATLGADGLPRADQSRLEALTCANAPIARQSGRGRAAQG